MMCSGLGLGLGLWKGMGGLPGFLYAVGVDELRFMYGRDRVISGWVGSGWELVIHRYESPRLGRYVARR